LTEFSSNLNSSRIGHVSKDEFVSKYRTAIIGCGPRGGAHAAGFIANSDRFELVACCDRNPDKLSRFATEYAVARTYANAEEMLAREKPEVLCFTTQPHVRLSLVELGVRHGVKVIAFEKPMANELVEARAIFDLCREAGVRIIVSHQQKYGKHWQQTKAIVDAGEIGEIVSIHATSRAWAGHQASHLMDYMLWFNNRTPIDWLVGQTTGTQMLDDDHPSVDFTFGTLQFQNGVRGIIECGAYAPRRIPGNSAIRTMGFWTDSSITIHGTRGYARVITGNGWSAVTKSSEGQVISGPGNYDPAYEQPLYIRDLADWPDGKIAAHPCDSEITYHGFEAVMAISISALERRRVKLPLETIPVGSMLERLKAELPVDLEYEGQ
jgi:predicted dehydrogenase